MAVSCPECSTPDSLHVERGMELPPDQWSDEIYFCIVECASCGFRGVAVFEESRRGALDSECMRSAVYRVPAEELSALQAAIEHCPTPKDRTCRCLDHLAVAQAHAQGERLRGGKWQEL